MRDPLDYDDDGHEWDPTYGAIEVRFNWIGTLLAVLAPWAVGRARVRPLGDVAMSRCIVCDKDDGFWNEHPTCTVCREPACYACLVPGSYEPPDYDLRDGELPRYVRTGGHTGVCLLCQRDAPLIDHLARVARLRDAGEIDRQQYFAELERLGEIFEEA
jgi:hypothetical protein